MAVSGVRIVSPVQTPPPPPPLKQVCVCSWHASIILLRS